MSKVLSITKNTIWGLGGLSIASCIARNDYNVVFSVLFLIILGNFYNQSPQVSSKIMIQLLTVLVVADIVWIITMSSGWSHSDSRSAVSDLEVFWYSLRVVHGIVYVLAYIEMILKVLLVYYLVTDYKGKYLWKDLFNCNYNKQDTMMGGAQNPMGGNPMGQINPAGTDLNFQNYY